MLDTNQINQVAQNAATIKAQVSANWPAICAALLWLRAEIKKLADWLIDFADYCIAHGGILRFIGKVFWVKGPKQ
jgi:hypothetical protein